MNNFLIINLHTKFRFHNTAFKDRIVKWNEKTSALSKERVQLNGKRIAEQWRRLMVSIYFKL